MSNSSVGIRRHPVVEALAAVDEALDSAADAAVWALDDAELESVLGRAEEIAARLAELKLRLVAEADGRDLGRRLGAASTAAWLRGRFRVRPAEARAQVEVANRIAAAAEAGPADYAATVAGPPSGREMPATAAALGAGAVSEAHAVVIGRTLGRLPAGLSAEACAEAERQLVALAGRFDPAVLARLADCLLDALRPDTLEADEDEAVDRRELRLSEHTGRISGRFDPEALAMLRAALDPLAAPQSADDDGTDQRPYPRRLADALVEITRRVLGHTDWLPTGHGARPHLNVVTQLNPDNATANDEAAGSDPAGSDPAGSDPAGSAVEAAEAADAADAADAAARGHGSSDGGRQHSAPGHGSRLGRGEPTWGRPLSAATIARLACDAGITWIITTPAGVPLTVGREQRTVTAGQWAALTVRDGGCTFPGCTRPVEWCEAHHIIWWRFGGPTDLDNLVLLCSHHHRAVHHHGWNIQPAPDRIPEFIPPSWVDPSQTPQRNNRPRYYHNKSPSGGD